MTVKSAIIKLRRKTEYIHTGVYYTILVLPFFSRTCVRGFASRQCGVLLWSASCIAGRIFIFGGQNEENTIGFARHALNADARILAFSVYV